MKVLLKYSKHAYRLTVILFLLFIPSLPFTAPTTELKLLAVPFAAAIGVFMYRLIWKR